MQTATYRFSVADLVDARTYAYNHMPAVRAIRLIPLILTLGCLLLGGYRAIQRDWSGVTSLSSWLVVSIALIVWMYLGNRLLLPGSVRKQMSRSKSLQDDIAITWDADRIRFESGHGEARWPWDELYQWQESRGGLLLWTGSQIYHYLPKRVLTDDQISELRANLTRALGKPGKRRK